MDAILAILLFLAALAALNRWEFGRLRLGRRERWAPIAAGRW